MSLVNAAAIAGSSAAVIAALAVVGPPVRRFMKRQDRAATLLFGDPDNLEDRPGLERWQKQQAEAVYKAAADAACAAAVAERLDAGQLHIIEQVGEIRQRQDVTARVVDDLAEKWRSNGGSSLSDKLTAVALVVTSPPRDGAE